MSAMSSSPEKSSESMADETANVSSAQQSPIGPVSTNYEPVTPEDKSLDRWTNLKFDAFDKSNVGYVATSSFIEDAHLTPDAVSLALTLFSATYVPLHPVSTIASFLVGPRYWISSLLFCCGVLCMCHAAVNGDGSLAALRLLLGCAEAGYNPCCVFLFSLYYPRYSLAIRMGVFTAMFAVSGAVAGLIAYGLLSVHTATIHGWQIVFLFEGGLTILMAVAVFILVPNKIEKARFLSPKERQHAVLRMEIDTQSRPAGSGRISWRDITDVLKDWKKLLIILFGICAITSMNAFPAFLPLLVQGMGYHGNLATLMSVPPFVAGIVGLMIAMWSSDRFKDRSSHLVGGLAVGLVGTVLMACAENNAVRYMATHICLPGVLTGASLISVWLANNTDEGGARSFVLGLNGVTHVGGVIAGQLYKVNYGPSYKYPLGVTAALLGVAIVGMLLVRWLYVWENRRRERITRDWGEAEIAEESRSTIRRGDQRLNYRFTL